MKNIKSLSLLGLTIIVGLGLIGSLSIGAPAAGSSLPDESHQPAPDFTLTSLDGERYTLSKLRGKVVLVNFWATWCPPCRREIPDLSRLHTKYKDRDFMVLGISLDEIDPDQIRKFAKNYKISYPVLHGPRSELGEIAKSYGGIQAIPTSFLIDKQGNIRARYIGARSELMFSADIIRLL
jgi:cytochrome c biogenesis protein CcmG/thiol:disulfide interchange protein DsbE